MINKIYNLSQKTKPKHILKAKNHLVPEKTYCAICGELVGYSMTDCYMVCVKSKLGYLMHPKCYLDTLNLSATELIKEI